MSGRFITFEGVDGAGKSSHLDWFAAELSRAGHEVLVTREPGGTALAESLRALLLNESMPDVAELLLMFAARADHVDRVIAPELARGTWVVCDRFTDSTLAYQGAGRGMDRDFITLLAKRVHPHCNPDRTYLFDLDPDTARSRRSTGREADRFEQEANPFFDRVRAGYAALAASDPVRFCKIDSSLTIVQIRQALAIDLARWLGEAQSAPPVSRRSTPPETSPETLPETSPETSQVAPPVDRP